MYTNIDTSKNFRHYCCSIIVPVSDRKDRVQRLLRTLTHQSRSPEQFEVIVCDDACRTPLKSVVNEFKASLPNLRCLRQDKRGLAGACNMGIIHARSSIIAFLDCSVDPDHHLIARLTEALNHNSEWLGVVPRRLSRDDHKVSSHVIAFAPSERYDLSGMAYRADTLRGVGGFDESLVPGNCESVELAARVLWRGKIGETANAIVYKAQEAVTVESCWRDRLNWRTTRIVASRYGILGFPMERTRFPRFQTALTATVIQPFRRILSAVRVGVRAPLACVYILMISVIECLGGTLMLPAILFETTPRRFSSVTDNDLPGQSSSVSRAA